MSCWNAVCTLCAKISCVARIHLPCLLGWPPHSRSANYVDPFAWFTQLNYSPKLPSFGAFYGRHMWISPPPSFSKYVYGEPSIPSFSSRAQMEYLRVEKMMLPTPPPPSATTHNMPVAYIIIRRSKSEKRASLTLCPNMKWPRLHWQIGVRMTTLVAD